MASKEQQYEQEFDFLVMDDLEDSKKPTKPSIADPIKKDLKQTKKQPEVNQHTMLLGGSRQTDDKLITLVHQSRLKSQENDNNQISISKTHPGLNDTLRLSNDTNLNISSKEHQSYLNPSTNPNQQSNTSQKGQMLISHTESLINNPNESQTNKSQVIHSEIGMIGNRQPQRRLMRKPIGKIQPQSKPESVIKEQQPSKESMRQQIKLDSKQQESKSQEQVKVIPYNNLDILPQSPLESNHTNQTTLPFNALEPNHKEDFLVVKSSLTSNYIEMSDFSLIKDKKTVGQLIKVNANGQLQMVPQKSSFIPPQSDNQITKSITRPLNLDKTAIIQKQLNSNLAEKSNHYNLEPIAGRQLEIISGKQLEIIAGKQLQSRDSLKFVQKISGDWLIDPLKREPIMQKIFNDPLKSAQKIDQIIVNKPLKGVQKKNEEKQKSEQKEENEQGIESLIGLLNMGNKKKQLTVPLQQRIQMTQSISQSVTNPINFNQLQSKQLEINKAQNHSIISSTPINQQLNQHSFTKPLQTTSIKDESIHEPHFTNPKNNKPGTYISCSTVQLTSLAKQLQKPIFAINQISNFTNNNQFKCSKFSHSLGDSHISTINYYGYSWTQIGNHNSTQNNDNVNKPKYNRDMLFGSKAKFIREIQQQQLQTKSITQTKSLYLYLQPNLNPLMKDSLKLEPTKQYTFSFHLKFNLHQRVNIAIDLLQTLYLVHQSDFMIFPNQLFPQKSDTTFLFALKQQQALSNSKLNNFQPQLKFGVHSLQPFKHLQGNSSNPFKLKQFIHKLLNLQKHNLIIQKQTKEDPKKLLDQVKPQTKIQTQLKSPQIKFYHEDWFWEIWNKSINNYIQKQTPNSSITNILNPKWIDLFQIPLISLKLIFGQEIINTLLQNKYEQILKTVNKIKPKQKPKPNEPHKKSNNKFDPTLLAKPDQATNPKLQLASQLLASSFLAPKLEEQILKLCQKPLLSWNDFEIAYKEFQNKHKKAPQTTNKQSTPKSSNQHSILSNPDSKKIFEQISNWISLLPFHEVSKDKFERKRLSSIKDLYDKLLKFKTSQKSLQLVPPVLNLKKNQKMSELVNKEGILGQNPNVNQNKALLNLNQYTKQKGLTVLSSQSATKSLVELKQQYLTLLQSNKTLSIEQFQSEYIKKPEKHLLTQEMKKKLSAAFLSHSMIMKSPKTYTLIYKSSVFNFTTKKFYQYCQNKERLLYVLKVRNERTLFYYNEEKIMRNKQMNGLFGNFVKDNKGTSFIYTGEQVLKVKNPNKAFAVSHIHGPIIGEGDIVIKEGNIDNEYNHPKSYETSKKAPKLLKSNRFVLDQMDVYELTF